MGSPFSWPTILTASLILLNFISLSFCLMSTNPFPTRTRTTTLDKEPLLETERGPDSHSPTPTP